MKITNCTEFTLVTHSEFALVFRKGKTFFLSAKKLNLDSYLNKELYPNYKDASRALHRDIRSVCEKKFNSCDDPVGSGKVTILLFYHYTQILKTKFLENAIFNGW